MDGSDWLRSLAQKNEFWYDKMVDNYPEQLCWLYARLHSLAKDGIIYGFFLELRDIFEGMIRWYVLTGIAYAEHLEKKRMVALLCAPNRSLSFGDWVNVFPRKLAEDDQIGSSPLGNLLAALEQLYNKEGIVRWRNEAIGHGALQQDTSESFQISLEKNILTLKQCLESNAMLARQIVYRSDADDMLCCEIGAVTFQMAPFIRNVAGDYRLFDSMTDKKGKSLCLELSYKTGKRTTVSIPYFFELQTRYYGEVPITDTSSFDEEVYTNQIAVALQAYHDPGQYWKQPHYMDWLINCLDRHRKGVFLLQAESGTGKSTFCRYLDGFGKAALKRRGFTSRVYYFSRLSYRTKQEFTDTLCDIFSQAPENEDRLHGKLPVLSRERNSDEWGAETAAFLNAYQAYHLRCYGRNKILLVLDGIDEMAPNDTDILHFVPNADLLDTGVYVLITCRSNHFRETFQQDFINCFSFTERVIFEKGAENRALLKQVVKDSVHFNDKQLTDYQVDQVCSILNNCFTGLPVIRAVLKDAQSIDAAFNASSLIDFYTSRLRQYYGAIQFAHVRSVLLTLALAYEPLSIRMISQLALSKSPTVELLAIMRDIVPLLQAVRDQDGTKYALGHPEFGALLRGDNWEECCQLVNSWRNQITGELDLENIDYDLGTYIAGGTYLWSKNILNESLISFTLLENMGNIASYYSKSKDTGLHLSRMNRIWEGTRQGLSELWRNTEEVRYGAKALDVITASIPNLVQLEDRMGCQLAEEESQKLILELPTGSADQSEFTIIFFSNYSNRSIMAERFGDLEKAQNYHNKAMELLFAHPDSIPNKLQIPFIHNCGIALLHTNPEITITICNQELSFQECTLFDRARALLLKGDALKAIRPPQQEEAGNCIRTAISLIENEPPKTSADTTVYPNALYHLGSHLCHAERNFEEAISVLTHALSIYSMQYKLGALPDRFAAARILSCIGSAYYGIDQRNGTAENKQCSLWHHDQSILVYRKALEMQIHFRPASAEPEFVNAVFAYQYYKEYDVALQLLDELEHMQDVRDPLYPQIIERCNSLRQELTIDPSANSML